MPDAFDADTIQECEQLAAQVARNGYKRPTITSRWLRDAERMKRIDGRTHEQVMAAIDRCRDDNIRSMTNLREKFDEITRGGAEHA